MDDEQKFPLWADMWYLDALQSIYVKRIVKLQLHAPKKNKKLMHVTAQIITSLNHSLSFNGRAVTDLTNDDKRLQSMRNFAATLKMLVL